MSKVSTCLWYEAGGEAAARFYVSLIEGSEIVDVTPGPAGEALMVRYHLAGTPYLNLNGGPHYKQSPAASIFVTTEDQSETDRLWAALTADGGEESRCGWCIDRWGVSWQVIPRALPSLIGGPDREAAGRATQAMFTMSKIDIAALQAAYDGR